MASALRIGFFGPSGTFTEQALLTQADLAKATTVPFRTVPDVLDAVESGEVDLGFVPIENSIEGTVNFTQDALVFDHDLLIQREVVLDIEHCVLAKKGATLAGIETLFSIPVATAQCHEYVRTNLGKADVRAANSTAEAARIVSESGGNTTAAIAPRNAAKVYGLKSLQTTLPTMQEIKRDSFWLVRTPFLHQLVMIALHSWCFNLPTNQAV